MFDYLFNPWRKWRASRHASHQLDAILAQFDPARGLAERNAWLIELAYWLRRADRPAGATSESWRYARLRYLLQVLDNNPALAERVGRTLRSIVRDNDPVSLLCDTGLSSRAGFWGELVDRLQARVLPPAPNQPQLAALFTLLFIGEHDAQWIDDLDDELVARIAALFQVGADDADEGAGAVVRLERSLSVGIGILVSQVRAAGLSHAIRTRMDHADVSDSPFYRLAEVADALFLAPPDAALAAGPERLAQRLNTFRAWLDQCRVATASVYQHLDENGVSVEVVFQVERMKAWLGRIDLLLTAWADTRASRRFVHLTAELVSASQHRRSVGYLVRATFADLARKVVERSAETGEHYITRDRKEYAAMVKAAAGGGAITAATVYLKFFITGAHLTRFTEGLFASINYAASFLGIHFAHFTLATKQPAMTAPALAHRLDQVGRPEGRCALRRRYRGDDPLQRGGHRRQPGGRGAGGFPGAVGGGAGLPCRPDLAGQGRGHHRILLGPRADAAVCGLHRRAAVAVQPGGGLGRQLVRAASRARRDRSSPAPAFHGRRARRAAHRRFLEAQPVGRGGQRLARLHAGAGARDPVVLRAAHGGAPRDAVHWRGGHRRRRAGRGRDAHGRLLAGGGRHRADGRAQRAGVVCPGIQHGDALAQPARPGPPAHHRGGVAAHPARSAVPAGAARADRAGPAHCRHAGLNRPRGGRSALLHR
ncbi:site-specific recombinase transmembrane protein [Ralstonia solanacearum SD54]|nr:site-specific recombinase transmembrane protein [Ralstonia solanacearum SD54]